MKAILVVAGALALSGCSTTATSYENKLDQIDRMAAQAFQDFNLNDPVPAIELVTSEHEMVNSGHVLARAVLYSTGREVLYVNQSRVTNRKRDRNQRHQDGERHLKALLDHEAAHFAAWRRYGSNIAMHGREFNDTLNRVNQ